MTKHLLNEYGGKKHVLHEALKQSKKHFSSPKRLTDFMVEAGLFDKARSLIQPLIGRDQEGCFWFTSTLQKLIVKHFEIEIAIDKAPIMSWPSVWSPTFKVKLAHKIENHVVTGQQCNGC